MYKCKESDGSITYRDKPCKGKSKELNHIGTRTSYRKANLSSIPIHFIKSPIACRFDQLEIPENLKVYGGYHRRPLKLSREFINTGRTVQQVDVTVHSPNAPVALILSDYDSTIWNIGWTERTKIVAVLVTGYHQAGIAGLPSSTPVINSTHDNKGPCGYGSLESGSAKNEILKAVSSSLFGKSIDKIYLQQKEGEPLYIGTHTPVKSATLTSYDVTPEMYLNKTVLSVGKKGLDEAILKGLIRQANWDDRKEWLEARLKAGTLRSPPKDTEIYVDPRSKMYIRNKEYVVLKDFRIPAGLYGSHSVTFYVPRYVSKPTGNPGHSQICYYKDGTCNR